MQNKAFIEHAYDILSESKKPLSFDELFAKTLKASGLELSEDSKKVKQAKLYMSLSDDARFAFIDKKWDLSARHSFDELHENDVDYDDEEDTVDEEEKELLREELGEEEEDDTEPESEDLDFDKKVEDADDDEDF